MAESAEEYAGRWGFPGKCDLPMRTLDLFVETIVNEIKPDIILWTGDNAPHNVWTNTTDAIKNITSEFVDLLLNKYKYQGAIHYALGNHEEYITDQFNPFDYTREKDWLEMIGGIARPFLKDDEYKNFVKYGYYTSKYSDTNLRIITFNCMLCDVINFFLIKNPTDPGQQFEWMEKVLRQAEQDNEYVFIMGHIPPGDATYLSECSRRYNALVDRFSNIIRGQFYGHSHYDEFRVITEYFNQNNTVGLILTAPSLTTWDFQHSSFRVFNVDYETKALRDYDQYRLNLTEANLTPDVKPSWKITYNGKQVNYILII